MFTVSQYSCMQLQKGKAYLYSSRAHEMVQPKVSASSTAPCAQPAVPLRPAPAQLAPALTLLLQWATHCPRASTPSA
jgi:hypothetical protein